MLAARATELERDFPFALVRQLFEPRARRARAPARERAASRAPPARHAARWDWTERRPGPHDTFAVLHGLYWLTAALAEQQPLLLAVDDAHWADAASLDYLGFLLPRLEELPVLLVMAVPPGRAGAAERPRADRDRLGGAPPQAGAAQRRGGRPRCWRSGSGASRSRVRRDLP